MKNTSEIDFGATTPAPLPEALRDRLLKAMLQAEEEEEKKCREMEQLLRRMRPAALPARLAGHLGVQMYVEAQQQQTMRHRRNWLCGGAAAVAAALALVAVAGSLLVPGNAVAEDEQTSLKSRNVIEVRGLDKLEWRSGGVPVRHFQVIYEDAVLLESADGNTVIQVPNTTQVEVEEEYL